MTKKNKAKDAFLGFLLFFKNAGRYMVYIIIQHIDTLPKYAGHKTLYVRRST